jgi:signal transduction histidine kinase
MKVYTKILLWCFGTLVLSLVAFIGVSVYISMRNMEHGSMGPRTNALLLEEGVNAWQQGGQPALAAHMRRVRKYLPGEHYFTDSTGRDLVSGEDCSKLLAAARPSANYPSRYQNRLVGVASSADGKYHFIAVFGNLFDISQFLPYYALILAAVAFLCWLLAANLAAPLRSLARAVDRFGAGDLSVRVNASRTDEIGEVGRAFDRMAERIATLLTAERRLLQDISHELRSPLARLSFAAELSLTAQDRTAATARMKKEIARLTDLVGGLIQVTRAEGDPAANNSESIRLDDLLCEVVEDCAVEAEARGCLLTLAPAPEISMRADREVLRRAIENVLRNAIRYTPATTAVEVTLEVTDCAARLTIRDYGPGVPEELLPRIFQPFFRVDDSRDTATGGVGLGLAIASRSIGLHHGTLSAENVQPGLRVLFELPLSEPRV